jgi:hypothetical protein
MYPLHEDAANIVNAAMIGLDPDLETYVPTDTSEYRLIKASSIWIAGRATGRVRWPLDRWARLSSVEPGWIRRGVES